MALPWRGHGVLAVSLSLAFSGARRKIGRPDATLPMPTVTP
jgi:hypothetical protein